MKELETLNGKLDKKQLKLGDFKKRYSESETRNTKLKVKLDNMKTFLKFLNSNFIRSMKQ